MNRLSHQPRRDGALASRPLIAQAIAALVLALAACVTPQIPLPPPSVDDLRFESVDPTGRTIRIASPGSSYFRAATVMIVNNATQRGVIAVGDPTTGAFTTDPLVVSEGDAIAVRYAIGDSLSDEICIVAGFSAGQPRLCP